MDNLGQLGVIAHAERKRLDVGFGRIVGKLLLRRGWVLTVARG